ncbi:hypothetical protein SAMN05421774_102786 [Gemmobacter megaterium]|uniref:Uncharacterized protein n=1 Tax=Gemmobacter megaterium TaxID=1086013 RepID=A0A1N7MLB6_9RHOB|nr:hypothetical protein SAMN05421774_102786 [Gemmobacter megaterium]
MTICGSWTDRALPPVGTVQAPRLPLGGAGPAARLSGIWGKMKGMRQRRACNPR